MTQIELDNVSVFYGSVRAIEDLTLTVRDGEILVLLGPSGSGKTTVIKTIAGLNRPAKGRLLFDGIVMNEVPPGERNVSIVFQSPVLFPHMSVAQNLAFPLTLKGMGKNEIRERVRGVAELLKITHLLDRKPSQLSGGERQRVSLGRAMVRKPAVFLMDEPLASLDAELKATLRAEIRKLHRVLGTTLIYVTHDQIEAMTLADRIAILDGGRLLQVENPEVLYSKPLSIRVAKAIGNPMMNFFECELSQEGGKTILQEGAIYIELPRELSIQTSSHKVTVGVRPENILLHRNETLDQAGTGVVDEIEPLGDSKIVTLDVSGRLVKVRERSDFQVSLGEKLHMTIPVRYLHFFDDSGKALV